MVSLSSLFLQETMCSFFLPEAIIRRPVNCTTESHRPQMKCTLIATVDFVHFQSGEQQFFTDHEKLESFRSDLVVAEAMERLYQQLNQPDIGIRMGEM